MLDTALLWISARRTFFYGGGGGTPGRIGRPPPAHPDGHSGPEFQGQWKVEKMTNPTDHPYSLSFFKNKMELEFSVRGGGQPLPGACLFGEIFWPICMTDCRPELHANWTRASRLHVHTPYMIICKRILPPKAVCLQRILCEQPRAGSGDVMCTR